VAAVYSHRFIVSYHGATEYFYVAAGTLAVVRWVTAFNGSAVDNETYNLVLYPPDVTIAWGSIDQNLGAPGTFSVSQEFRTVVNEGEYLKWFADGNIDGTVSGYVLTLP
jgi:hypothetical protein